MSEVRVPDEIEMLATTAVNAAFAVHRALGPGLLESAYRECMGIELSLAGLAVQGEQLLPLNYRGHAIRNAYRLDLIVNEKLLIELEKRYFGKLSFRSEPGFHAEQFKIVNVATNDELANVGG